LYLRNTLLLGIWFHYRTVYSVVLLVHLNMQRIDPARTDTAAAEKASS